VSAVSWQEVERVLAEILDLPEAERILRLETLCAGHADLEAQVKSLLAAHNSAGSFFEPPSHLSASAAWNFSFAEKQLGSYRLLHLVETGGMGAVYRAERTDVRFQKQVAIKVVPAALHSPELLRRFTSEQQILAPLDHPNIAQLLDAGVSPEGIPYFYFVMEYVEGIPVNKYELLLSIPQEIGMRHCGTQTGSRTVCHLN